MRFLARLSLCILLLPLSAPASAPAEEWRGLVIAPEDRCPAYDRKKQ